MALMGRKAGRERNAMQFEWMERDRILYFPFRFHGAANIYGVILIRCRNLKSLLQNVRIIKIK
jgi:hypothetical protein